MKFPFTGLTSHITEKDPIPKALCPNCLYKGPMSLFCTSLSPRIYHLPLLKIKKTYTALCPHCAARLRPSPQALRAARRKSPFLVWSDQLTIVQSFV